MQNSALPTSSKRRRLTSKVWNDFERVEVDGKHRAICNHCHKCFSGLGTSGTTHLRNHLSRCSTTQSGELSKRRRSASKVWNDFKKIEVGGKRRALCAHCGKDFPGSSKSGTTHLKNHLSRCSAKKNGESYKNMISSSEIGDLKNPTVINGNSVFDEERSDRIQVLDPVFREALVCGKDSLDNPIRIAPIKNDKHSLELTHTSFVSAGNFLSLEPQEKHAPSNVNTELMHANHTITPNRDNEYSPELTQNSFVLPGASLSFEPQEKHAPHSSNMEFMLANPSSTSCPEPGPTGHSSFVSAGTYSCLELQEKHAPSSANMESMLTNLSSTSCSEPLPTSHTSFVSAGTSLSLESQEEHAPSSANMKPVIANHSSTTGYSSFVLAGTSSSLKPQEKHAPSSANTERMLANLSSTSCSEPLPTGHSSFVLAGTSSILEPQEKHGRSSANMELMLANHNSTLCRWSFPTGHSSFDSAGTSLSLEAEEADAQNLMISAFEHLGEIVPFDDEASLVGSSSHLANVRYTSRLPRTESSNGSKVLACHKFGGCNNTQQSASSPDIISSIYADGGLDYSLHTIDRMGLRYEQALSFPESMNHSFDVDHMNFYDIDLLTQNVNLESQSDLQCAVDNFLSVRATFPFDDEASLVGSSSHLANVRYTSRLPRTESSNGSKVLACHKFGGCNNTQQSASSPDIISSIYADGGLDYSLHTIDRMGLRYEQALSFPESMNHSFDVDHMNFYDIDLLTQNVNLESQSDLQFAVDNFLSVRATFPFDDEASLVGSSSHLANVRYTSRLPRTESSNGSKVLACIKFGGCNNTQQSASSPDIISSIYADGGLDYSLHTIDRMGLRYEQALSFPESMNHSFDVDHMNFYDIDLLTQNVNLESQLDLQCAVDNFLSVRATFKSQTRWTKLFSMLKWFSVRVVIRRRVKEIPRYKNGVWGTGMSAMTWEVNVERTRTCLLDKRMFFSSPPSSQQKTGGVFDGVGQVIGQHSECQNAPIDKLSETEKTDARNLVMPAFEHRGEVVSFNDEPSIVASPPRMESSNGCKFLASHKIGGFDYAQQSASSPDIISSIYSVGGSSGLEDFSLPGIDSMGLRYEQALSFPESINHSFDDDHLNFFDTDLLTQCQF